MTEQTATAEIAVTSNAVEDMRDTLLEMGFVAVWATRENIIAKIDRKFGPQNWLTHYGHAA